MDQTIRQGFLMEENDFPINKNEASALLGVAVTDVGMVLQELGVDLKKSGQSIEITEFAFNVLVLFKRVKEILKQRKIKTMINVGSIHLVKALSPEYIDFENETISNELTLEVVLQQINLTFEA